MLTCENPKRKIAEDCHPYIFSKTSKSSCKDFLNAFIPESLFGDFVITAEFVFSL
jgi:hypothetical protein